jgi:Xaa-Pro aminopeptidase
VSSTDLSRSALETDVSRRIAAAQELIRQHDVKLIVAVVAGVPGRTGWMRYFAAANLDAARAFVIIEPRAPDPLIIVASDDAAAWVAATATTRRIDSTYRAGISPMARVVEVVAGHTGGRGRIGTLNFHDTVSRAEHEALAAALPDLSLVDMTDAANAIRQVKSPFEIAAMEDMGRILTAALDRFSELARPGRSMMEVAADIEGFVRSRGGLGGRIKYSVGERPYTIPPVPGQRFSAKDIFVFQFVYMSALGYWYELSRLYSFKPLPRETALRLKAMEEAMTRTAALAVPGNNYGTIVEASDEVFSSHGFNVIGKHTEDCHTIGTDIRDGANITPDNWMLQDGAVLALHPASLLEGDLGFFLIDHVVVRNSGGVRLAPTNAFYQRL